MSQNPSCCVEQSLTLPSKGENLALLRHFVIDFAKQCEFTEDDVFDISVAVGEACSNALEHGSPEKEKNNIYLICTCTNDHLLIHVKDEGRFNKRSNFVPLNHEDNSGPSGRGVMLMLAVMDKVSVDENTDGTTVTLIKNHKINFDNIAKRFKKKTPARVK